MARRVSDGAASVEPCDPDTPAIITFTSGSTGEPKAAVRTHGFLIAQHRALVESLALAPGEIDLCTLPIFLLANLASGVTSVIPDADLRAPGAIDPAPVDAQIRAMRPTRTVASPAFVARLVDHAVRHGGQLDTFRRIYTGGAPVFPEMLDAIAAVAPDASVVAVYGSTEAEPIAEIDRRDISADDRAAMTRGAGLLAGRPVSSIQLRILPDRWGTPVGPWTVADLERDTLGPDEVGEIVVTGEHVLSGYLDGHGDEETKITVGERVWHRTGDAGYLDAQGRLWLLGRCSAKANDSDGVLYPFAVECAAGAVAGVGRTAFVMHRGRRILAAEVHGDAAAVRAELMDRLAWARAGGHRDRPADSRRSPPQRQGGLPGVGGNARSCGLTGHLLMADAGLRLIRPAARGGLLLDQDLPAQQRVERVVQLRALAAASTRPPASRTPSKRLASMSNATK